MTTSVYVVGPPCIDVLDRSCVDVCPVDDCMIELDRMMVINPDTCIGCSACEAECPVEAIVPADGLPEDWLRFPAINRAISDGRDAANALVIEYAQGA